MSPALRDYEFRVGLWGTLAALAGTAVFTALMLWQIGRADEKRMLQAEFEARRALPPILYSGGELDMADMRYRKVSLRGHFRQTGQLLLDNVVHDGAPGYQVITPFQLDNEATVLVDRGWVPQGPRRDRLPDLSVTEVPVTVEGWLDHHRSRPVLGADRAHYGSDIRWLYVDIDEYEKFSGLEVPNFIVHLEDGSPAGYATTPARFDANVGMHIGYAIQWGAFALGAAGTWLALAFKRRK